MREYINRLSMAVRLMACCLFMFFFVHADDEPKAVEDEIGIHLLETAAIRP